ncbi:MAG TPA: hypothetical protein VGR76_06385, partial [Candidatus Angelobacter sp.]|nr:hypothetical protein [Candidatus Angelobacter sp.]
MDQQSGMNAGMNALEKLFLRHFGEPAGVFHPLQNNLGGSGRRIVRLATGGRTAIGILHDVR